MDLNPATATVETEEVLHNASDADHSTKNRPDDDPEPQGAVYIDPEMSTVMQDLLKALDTGLQKRTVQGRLSNQAGEDEALGLPTVRWIAGHRLEIFFTPGRDARLKRFIPDLPDNWGKLITDYCVQQATKDRRVQRLEEATFHSFSIITAWNDHPAQPCHVDCAHPNLQFGLMVSKRAPWTVCAPYRGIGVTTAKELVELWQQPVMLEFIGVPPPCSLLTKLGQNPETSELIRVCTFLFRSEHPVTVMSCRYLATCSSTPRSSGTSCRPVRQLWATRVACAACQVVSSTTVLRANRRVL